MYVVGTAQRSAVKGSSRIMSARTPAKSSGVSSVKKSIVTFANGSKSKLLYLNCAMMSCATSSISERTSVSFVSSGNIRSKKYIEKLMFNDVPDMLAPVTSKYNAGYTFSAPRFRKSGRSPKYTVSICLCAVPMCLDQLIQRHLIVFSEKREVFLDSFLNMSYLPQQRLMFP